MNQVRVNEIKSSAYHFIKRALKEKERYIILYGGRNSTKSYSAMQVVKDLGFNTEEDICWFRKKSVDLMEKAREPFVKYMKSASLYNKSQDIFNNINRHYIFPKGNRLLWSHANNEDSFKGIAGVKYVFIDEIDQFTKEEAEGLFNSFRSLEGIKIIILFNPVDKTHWLHDMFFVEKKPIFRKDGTQILGYKDRSRVQRFTVEDNPFATQDDIDQLDALQISDYNRYLVDRLGEWGSISVGDPFIDGFNYNQHVSDLEPKLIEGYDYLIGFDFGSTDSCVLAQIFREDEIRADERLQKMFGYNCKFGFWVVKEYRLGTQTQNVRGILASIFKEFGYPLGDCFYYIYGDNAGNATDRIDLLNAVDELEMRDYVQVKRWNKPRHVESRRQINWMMRSRSCSVLIQSNCKTLIRDLLEVRINEIGAINKEDCKKYDIGHVMDAFRYIAWQSAYVDFASSNLIESKKDNIIYI